MATTGKLKTIGANVWAKSPKPENNTSGKETTRLYDEIGRLQKETLVNTGAYTRYEYPQNNIQSKVYATVIDTNNNGADAADEVYAESWTDGAGRVLRARTEHPNSSGGWTGTLTEYDILGRVKRSTIPTEINANYEPVGDDYRLDAQNNVTFLWKHQKYDWKSRVVRIINTDGVDSPNLNDSDQLFSYEGCGCAGGQITTVQGELVPRNDNPNQTARRTQKIYADILGRTKKTEILNWDNSVYTTTTQTFNGRDQVLKTTQYAGAESSSNPHQTVLMTYDGHGRMATRHYPIEDSGATTSWIYNNDDSIQQVIDPRNAITNFSYNSRGLMNQISYSVPSPNPTNIPVTPTVNYTYDSLGNRTQMMDGLGSTSYEYSPLSQLISETRNFSDSLPNAPLPNNGFRIEYGYNLSGGLKFYKDPFGQQIDYANDKTGKLTGVTGSVYGTGAEATTEYADTIKYRAWGAVKSLFYRTNDNSHIRMEYDNRLRVVSHEVESYGREGGFVKKATFSYLADSRLSMMDNVVNPEFDRTYSYDHIGRLKTNSFGLSQMTYPAITPYEQTVQYDQFSQMTNRNTTYWGENTQFTSTFTNGREQTNGVVGTQYDAAGNMINTGERAGMSGVFQASKFDVANRRTEFTSRTRQRSGRYSYIYTNRSTLQFYDGDGHALKQQEQLNNVPLAGTEKYQIWSSVLKSYLTETEHSGGKRNTKVFAGGAVIAEQMRRSGTTGIVDEVTWIHADPVSGSSERVNKDGSQWYRTEYEPLGNQEVSIFGLDEDFPEPQQFQGESEARAEDPQWRCQMEAAMGTEFNSLPVNCQIAIMQQPDEIEVVWGNPLKIDEDAGEEKDGQTAGDAMPVEATSTDKPQGSSGTDGGAIPASSTPSADGSDSDESDDGYDNDYIFTDAELTIKARNKKRNIEPSEGNISSFVGADDIGGITIEHPERRIFKFSKLFDEKISDGGKALDELTHCNKDIKTRLGELIGIWNRLKTSSTGKTPSEYGFVVLRINGQLQATQIFTSDQQFSVYLGQYRKDQIVAVFHTHPFEIFPSGNFADVNNPNVRRNDVQGAYLNDYIQYVYTVGGGLTLFNPQNPTENGKDRKIKAPKCPKNN